MKTDKNLLQMLFLIIFCSCSNANQQDQNIKSQEITNIQKQDSLELFFKSNGVLVFNATDENLEKSFKLLNEDNTVYATLNLKSDKIIIQSQIFSLSKFANNKLLLSDFQFYPKAFYPNNFIIQFEYTNIHDSIADIFLDKTKNLKKKININNNLFKVESWKEHLIGCMIDFNEENNPIRVNNNENAKSIGYENSGEDFVFVISEISGDWIKIECSDICGFPCSSGKKYDGWIRWKKGDVLLIHLLYAC